MHASPPFQMTVSRFGVWRVAASLLVSATAVVVGVWTGHSLAFATAWAGATMVVLVLLSIAVLTHAWRQHPVSLRWDTQRWHLGAAATVGLEPQAGRLAVSMDLGGWMLLHFVPDDATVLQRGTWLPVQRRGHETSWHALRCTVYCARPVSLPTVAPF